MAAFYFWGLRNTFVALAMVFGAAGYVGIFQLDLTLSAIALCAFVACIGSQLGRRSKRRTQKREAIAREIAAAHALRERFANGQKNQRRAA